MGNRKLSSSLGTWLALACLISFMPLKTFAYTVGQVIVYDNTTYVVSSIDDQYNYVTCIGTTKSGTVSIPATFTSGDVTCEVTKVAYQSVDESNGRSCHFSDVTQLSLPNTVTYFGTILSSKKLSRVAIPESCTQIVAPFDNTTWIPTIILTGSNPNYVLDNGILYNKDKSKLIAVPSNLEFTDGTFTVPEGVWGIERGAIINNSSLVTLSLPSTLSSVDNNGWPGAISHCENFTTITGADNENFSYTDGLLIDDSGELMIYPEGRKTENYKLPDDVLGIGKYAFYNPLYLKSIDLNNVEGVYGSPAFYACTKLTSITFGSNVEQISDGAFGNCTALESYSVDGDNQYYKSVSGVLFTKDGKTLIAYPAQRDAGDDEEYTIPDGTEKVGKNAFMGAQRLQVVDIPTSLKTIGNGAFSYVPYLEDVNFMKPSNVTSIETWAFRNCDRLNHITLPASLTELQSNVFQDCDNLYSVKVEDGSQLKNIVGNAFSNLKSLEHFSFNGSSVLTSIGSNAFSNCTKLESIEIPATVTTINTNAFQGCSSMTEVTFAENASITKIGAGAFANCGLESIEIPTSVVTIEAEAFNNCDALTRVDLSANTTDVSPQAFIGCSNLTTFTVASGNPTYSAVKGYLLSKDKTTLVIFPAGKANDNVTLLPPSLTSIGDYAFYHCDNLTNVVIPKKVTKIGKRAFGYCDNLNFVTFLCDEKITDIPEYSEAETGFTDATNNITAFDNGYNRDDQYNAFKHIKISVRKDLADQYMLSDHYYTHFDSIETSFKSYNINSDIRPSSNDNNYDEYMPVSSKSVMLLSVSPDKSFQTYVVNSDVKVGSGSKSISHGQVSMISDYAFEGTDIYEVVVPKTVMYIGAMAFITDVERTTSNGTETIKPKGSNIKDIVFCGDMLTDFQLATQDFELSSNYNEFTSDQRIYVRKSQLSDFQTAMPAFSSQISYKIPGVSISKTYGSFDREFDTDFTEYFNENNSNGIRVAAFSGSGTRLVDASAHVYAVRLTSVDELGGKTGDYGYVPASTPVLLKVLGNTATPSDFWYTIGEDQGKYTVNHSDMAGATINGKTYDLDLDNEWYYVLSGGALHPITTSTFTLPVHKAWLVIDKPEEDSEAKVVFEFGDGETTGISGITAAEDNAAFDGKTYNLNGQRVSKATKGIYLRNGKKFVVK